LRGKAALSDVSVGKTDRTPAKPAARRRLALPR
jgi:hypothetical protein